MHQICVMTGGRCFTLKVGDSDKQHVGLHCYGRLDQKIHLLKTTNTSTYYQ